GDPSHCSDRHFDFSEGVFDITADKAHTGRRSIKVQQGNAAVMRSVLRTCPPIDCGYTVDLVNGLVTISGTSGPYEYLNITPVLGDPDIELTAGGLMLTGMGEWGVELSISDANGCVTTTNITDP